MSEVRVRIAPSPTGDPHVGTGYIALLNLVFARHHGGKFILRIEDTDRSRSRPIYEENIYKALKWLGIEWDEGPDIGGPYGPYRQSDRLPLYQQFAHQLLVEGKAYKCFATPEELLAMRKESKSGYNRLYRDLSEAEVKEREERGESYVIRLKSPRSGLISFVDAIMGPISVPCEEIDDQILIKRDGFPTYHLANVVDDHLMKISHVLRGNEWLTSTPKHLLLYQALGFEPPKFYHLPLLLNRDGKKLSKRKNPCSIFYFKDAGYQSEALLNFLSLMGYRMDDEKEIYSLEELIATFNEKNFGISGAFFDRKKLDWLNQQYLLKMDDESLWSAIFSWAFPREKMVELMQLVRPRMHTLSDFAHTTTFLFSEKLDLSDDLLCSTQRMTKEKAKEVLQCLIWFLDEKESWTKESIELGSKELSSFFGLDHKKEVMPLLFGSLMAKRSGLPLYRSFEFLGKDRSRARFLNAIDFLGGLSEKEHLKLKEHWDKRFNKEAHGAS